MQVSFDTPYYPETTRDRVFDYIEMAGAVDFYMVMAYDIRLWDSAWANSPLNITIWGMYICNSKNI